MKAGGQDLVPMTRKTIKDMQDEIERLSTENSVLWKMAHDLGFDHFAMKNLGIDSVKQEGGDD